MSTFTGQMLNRKDAFILRMEREQWKRNSLSIDFSPIEDFENDEDIKIMRKRYSSEFQTKFAMAFANYEAGEWQVAKKMLDGIPDLLPELEDEEDLTQNLVQVKKKDEKGVTISDGPETVVTTRKLMNIFKKKNNKRVVHIPPKKTGKVDGPSQTLLTFMKSYDYVAPKGWKGHRNI
jgi:hypothetical protein